MVSKASDDLPEPESPVTTTSALRGISRSTFFRLCTRAPVIFIFSSMSCVLFADVHQRKKEVVKRYPPYKVGETYRYDKGHKHLYEALAPMYGVVRRKKRAYDVARAVQQTEEVVALPAEHKDSEREGGGDEYYEALDDIGRDDIHTHRPERDGQYEVADADIYVSAIEAYNQKPQVVPRLDCEVVPLANLNSVVEYQVEEYDDEYRPEAYLEDGLVNLRGEQRAGYISDDDGQREHQPLPQVEHLFAYKGKCRREILHQHGDTVCSVCYVYRQAESHEHRHCDNRPSSGEGSGIFDETKEIELWAYNIETVLAEKVETILRRGELNTRPRDFYDIHILCTTQKYDSEIFKNAFWATAEHRGSAELIKDVHSIVETIKTSTLLQNSWKRYSKEYKYSENISYEMVTAALENITETL